MGAAAVAVMIKKEKEVVQTFRDANATSPAAARTLDELMLDGSSTIRRLRQRAVLRETDPGRFYLDELSWEALGSMRRRLSIVMLVIILAVLFFTLGISAVLRRS